MSELSTLERDVARFFNLTTDQATGLIDRLTPTVLIQSMAGPFDVPRVDRSSYMSSVFAPAAAGGPSTTLLINPTGTGVDVIVEKLSVLSTTADFSRWGRLASTPAGLTLANVLDRDRRIPTKAVAQPAFGEDLLSFLTVVTTHLPASVWVEMPTPFVLVAGQTWGLEVSVALLDVFMQVEWTELPEVQR